MRALSLYIIMILSLCSCYEASHDCSAFKTGTYIWEQEIQGKTEQTKFVRTETHQIEYYKGEVDSSLVTWINDCEYRISPLNPDSNAESRAYLFRIVATTNQDYTFDFKQSGREGTYRGTATKQ